MSELFSILEWMEHISPIRANLSYKQKTILMHQELQFQILLKLMVFLFGLVDSSQNGIMI